MTGLYIHIPFCKSKCLYCNFYAVASKKLAQGFVEALLQEIETRSHQWKDPHLRTVYMGGGTPSLLLPGDIENILDFIKRYFILEPSCEITLEANPDDISMQNLESWSKAGINRLSIGIQSQNETILKFLGRHHTAEQALEAYAMVRKAGFNNISVDLIYGIQGLNNEEWENALLKILSLEPEHFSCYALTLEEKTPYDFQVKKGKLSLPDEELVAQQYEILQEISSHKGYIQYEISNFCLPGYYSRHNTAYWQGIPYLGLGPSAHSYDGIKRWWNPSCIEEWKKLTTLDIGACPCEILTSINQYNEYIITSLRTSWGLSISHINKRFGEKFTRHTLQIANSLTSIYLKKIGTDRIAIKSQAYILADCILERFILMDDSKI